jgi:hypothetical protein
LHYESIVPKPVLLAAAQPRDIWLCLKEVIESKQYD